MSIVKEVSWLCDHCGKRFPVDDGEPMHGWVHVAIWQHGDSDHEQIDVCPICATRVSKTVRGLRVNKRTT